MDLSLISWDTFLVPLPHNREREKIDVDPSLPDIFVGKMSLFFYMIVVIDVMTFTALENMFFLCEALIRNKLWM